eukprot:TRINITY_DN720_c3_g1_i2.p2 TRINITY_DN720_c3_g1~~TRINITY_DN720_c3_g1_i2.p2  ORF type:complete len:131 (+),score=33.19 TRINITY_DN720_c3_g1_i2:456-848(+)
MSTVKVWEAVEVYGDGIGRMNLTENDKICIVRDGDTVPLRTVGLQSTQELVLMHESPAAVVAATSRRSHADTSMLDMVKGFLGIPVSAFTEWYSWMTGRATAVQEDAETERDLIERYWNPQASAIDVKLE